jgi:hypothetical protein
MEEGINQFCVLQKQLYLSSSGLKRHSIVAEVVLVLRPPSWHLLLLHIIHHHPSPSIIIHHHPSSSIIIHHHPSFIIIHHHPSPSIIIHHPSNLSCCLH